MWRLLNRNLHIMLITFKWCDDPCFMLNFQFHRCEVTTAICSFPLSFFLLSSSFHFFFLSFVIRVKVTSRLTVGQSVTFCCFRAPSEAHDQILVLEWTVTVLSSLRRRRVYPLSVVTVNYTLYFVRPCLKSTS